MIKKINHEKVKTILTDYLAKNFDKLVEDCNCIEVVTFITGDESFLIDYHGFLVQLHFFSGLTTGHYAGCGFFSVNKESSDILSVWANDSSKRKKSAKKSFMFKNHIDDFKTLSFDIGVVTNRFKKY